MSKDTIIKTVFTLFKDDMMAKARELFDGEIEE